MKTALRYIIWNADRMAVGSLVDVHTISGGRTDGRPKRWRIEVLGETLFFPITKCYYRIFALHRQPYMDIGRRRMQCLEAKWWQEPFGIPGTHIWRQAMGMVYGTMG